MINAARVIRLSLLGAILLAGLLAQYATGKIAGVATDPSGAVASNATVTVANLATNFRKETKTDSSGVYQALLPIGKYKITATALGFEKLRNALADMRRPGWQAQ